MAVNIFSYVLQKEKTKKKKKDSRLHLGLYHSLDIICSSKLTVFRTRNSSRQIMSIEKYPSTFSLQVEATDYVSQYLARLM